MITNYQGSVGVPMAKLTEQVRVLREALETVMDCVRDRETTRPMDWIKAFKKADEALKATGGER